MPHNVPHEDAPSGGKTVQIQVNLPVEIDARLKVFKETNGYVSKSVAIVKIVEARLFPLLNGG